MHRGFQDRVLAQLVAHERLEERDGMAIELRSGVAARPWLADLFGRAGDLGHAPACGQLVFEEAATSSQVYRVFRRVLGVDGGTGIAAQRALCLHMGICVSRG